MRKEILVTNYYPAKLREARESAGIEFTDLEGDDAIDIDQLSNLETADEPIPVDIFYLAYLYIKYKTIAEEQGVTSFMSLTSDIMFPHPKGIAYQEFIVGHENYRGFPVYRKSDGQIKWVATVKTREGQERVEFWERKRIELGIEASHVLDAGIRQKVAFANHPDKKHICLFSGSELSIDYRYPSPSKIDSLNKAYQERFKYYDLDIFQLSQFLYPVDKCKNFAEVMGIGSDITSLDDLQTLLKTEYVDQEKKPYVSPGAMSNSPDRLDGYHSYNNDVREITDTGRYKDNLRRYTQDRRVYEMWSGGNWKMADRLYATFVKNGVSPDHIGPMSLGFAHRPKFHPMTASQNSSKGNRMSYEDVMSLIEDEANGEEVITWHSKPVWDRLKGLVRDDQDAVKLSALMRTNLHHVLIIFSIIKEHGYIDFLNGFLNPQYSYFDYEFIGFNAEDGSYERVEKKRLEGRNQQNNAERYIRIAYETLDQYIDKENRKNKIWSSDNIDRMISQMTGALEAEDAYQAKEILDNILNDLAELARTNW